MANFSNSYGKKSYFVEEANYGFNFSEGNLRINQDDNKDQFRMDLGAVWSFDTLGYSNNIVDFKTPGPEENSSFKRVIYTEGNNVYGTVFVEKPTAPSSILGGQNVQFNDTFGPFYQKQKITCWANGGQSNIDTLASWEEYYGDNIEAAKTAFRTMFMDLPHFNLIVKGQKETYDNPVEALFSSQGVTSVFYAESVGYDISEYPSVQTEKMFTDHYFEISTPFGPEEQALLGNLMSPVIADISAEYNFYTKVYEEFTMFSGLSEEYLPNIYVLLTKKYENEMAIKAGQGETSTPLYLGIPPEELDFLDETGEKSDFSKSYDYFSKYANILSNNSSNTKIINEINKNKNIGVTTDNVKYLLDYNKKSSLFPMHVNIEFSTQKDTTFAQMIDDSKVNVPLIRTAMESSILNNTFEASNFRKATEKIELSEGDMQTPVFSTDAQLKTVKSINLTNWITAYDEEGEEYFSDEAEELMRFIGDSGMDVFNSTDPENQFYKSFVMMLLKGKVTTLAKEKMRTFDEVLRGVPAYSEAVLYRIAKHEVFDDGGVSLEPIQNFYFTNSNSLDIARLKDTQVVFGKTYKYVIHAYCLVIGTKYTYLPGVETKALSGDSTYDFQATFEVLYAPSIMLVEVPYYGQEANEDTVITIYDDPPVPPDVNMVPYRAINNKIGIKLNSNVGEYITDPIILLDNDQEIYNNVRGYQKLVSPNKNKVRFSTDDPPKSFQVFRIEPDFITGETKRPYSYSSFKDNLYTTISSQDTTAGAMIDAVRPNKKYYYCFRSVDVHGNISLPSPVYELEMVSEPGGQLAYPLIRVIEFTNPLDSRYIKSMRRFLHVDPAEGHLLTNGEISPDTDIAPILGTKQDTLFVNDKDKDNANLKTFKIRLTSKQTGKRIDLNVKFVHVHNKIFG